MDYSSAARVRVAGVHANEAESSHRGGHEGYVQNPSFRQAITSPADMARSENLVFYIEEAGSGLPARPI